MVQIIGLTINKLKNGEVRRKADYRISSYLSLQWFQKALLHNVLRSPLCKVNGEINALIIIVFVICKILSIWSHPLKGPFISVLFLFLNVFFIFFNTCFNAITKTNDLTISPLIHRLSIFRFHKIIFFKHRNLSICISLYVDICINYCFKSLWKLKTGYEVHLIGQCWTDIFLSWVFVFSFQRSIS